VDSALKMTTHFSKLLRGRASQNIRRDSLPSLDGYNSQPRKDAPMNFDMQTGHLWPKLHISYIFEHINVSNRLKKKQETKWEDEFFWKSESMSAICCARYWGE
jgi:hypothetical protein